MRNNGVSGTALEELASVTNSLPSAELLDEPYDCAHEPCRPQVVAVHASSERGLKAGV